MTCYENISLTNFYTLRSMYTFMKTCRICKEKKHFDDYPWYGNLRKRNTCRVCYNHLQKIKMRARRVKPIQEILTEESNEIIETDKTIDIPQVISDFYECTLLHEKQPIMTREGIKWFCPICAEKFKTGSIPELFEPKSEES